MTNQEFVKDMGVGINLGNTFDAFKEGVSFNSAKEYYMMWYSPELTQECIQNLSKIGFKTLRIPVSWSNMMREDYRIHSDYIYEVKKIADWALAANMYVIINLHHDGNWIKNISSLGWREQGIHKFERIWEQLAYVFKDYNEKLLFEDMNEDADWLDIWDRHQHKGDKEAAYQLLNRLNQLFVDIVRGRVVSEQNKIRRLIIAGYATDIDATCDELYQVPQDNNVFVSLHYYNPIMFTLFDEEQEWGKLIETWGTEEDYKSMKQDFMKVKEWFLNKNIPVILGEYKCMKEEKDYESICKWTKAVTQECLNIGICPIYWDINEGNFLYDREKCEIRDKQMIPNLIF